MSTNDAPVVVGVAGTADDDAALCFAADEARRQERAVLLVHAYRDTPEYPTTHPLISREDRRKVGQNVLTTASERLKTLVDDTPEVRTHLAETGIVPALLEASTDAAMVVLRRRDLSTLERVFTGSIITGVAARAVCPVVSVPARWDHLRTFQRVVAGLDDAAISPEALDAAFPAAAQRGATLTVVHAWRAPTLYDDIIFSRTSESSWRDERRQHLEEVLAPWHARYPDVAVDVVVEYERPAQALKDASASSDLLVVGRRTRALPRGLALGSVTRALVRDSACPLMVAPYPDDASAAE